MGSLTLARRGADVRYHSERSEQNSSAVIDDLRAQIQAIQHGSAPNDSTSAISLGDSALDLALPWNGLPGYGLHEISGNAAAIGFAATLLARRAAAQPEASVLWCQPGHELYPYGLAQFGLNPDRLILAHGANDTDILWAMEEGLRTPGLLGVLGRVRKIPPIAARRLQLAAEESGVMCLLLRPEDTHAPASAALTRWRITTAPGRASAHDGPGFGAPSWHLELQRCRLGQAHNDNRQDRQQAADIAGKPRAWEVEWSHETGGLALAAGLCDRPAEPHPFQQAAH